MASVAKTPTNSKLSLADEARLALLQENLNERDQASVVLLEAIATILGSKWRAVARVCLVDRDGRQVPAAEVDGLILSYFDDKPGLYVRVLCDECGGATRAVFHTKAELGAVLQRQHFCPSCVRAHERAEGVEF